MVFKNMVQCNKNTSEMDLVEKFKSENIKIKDSTEIKKNIDLLNGSYIYFMTDLASIYNVPKPKKANIAVISLDGGLKISDALYNWSSCHIPLQDQPNINIVLLDGATGTLGINEGADLENALDVQIVGAMCPSSKTNITIYISINTDQGFIDAVKRAIDDKNDVIGISWGIDEKLATPYAIKNLNKLFKQAVNEGINVFCVLLVTMDQMTLYFRHHLLM